MAEPVAAARRSTAVDGQARPAGFPPLGRALVGEAVGTAVLVFVIFALTDPGNRAAPTAHLVPFFVGFTVAGSQTAEGSRAGAAPTALEDAVREIVNGVDDSAGRT